MANESAVYEVDLSKKYILVLPEHIKATPEIRERIIEIVRTWKNSDDPFLILPDGVKLVRIDG